MVGSSCSSDVRSSSVGHWFVFVAKDRADDDEYSRGLLLVARPVRLLGLIVAAGGVLWFIADAVG